MFKKKKRLERVRFSMLFFGGVKIILREERKGGRFSNGREKNPTNPNLFFFSLLFICISYIYSYTHNTQRHIGGWIIADYYHISIVIKIGSLLNSIKKLYNNIKVMKGKKGDQKILVRNMCALSITNFRLTAGWGGE
jgi:cbb3-type cytochrome oxidase subunit 3